MIRKSGKDAKKEVGDRNKERARERGRHTNRQRKRGGGGRGRTETTNKKVRWKERWKRDQQTVTDG